jgi:hypothetical protein
MRGPDLVRHLTTLADLHVAGALSADEFALAKQRLLSSVSPLADRTDPPGTSSPAVVGDGDGPAGTNSSRPAALLVVGCCMAIATTLWIIGITHGEGGFNQVVTAVIWVVVIGMQAYYLWRVHQTWDLLPARAQWKLMLAAVLFPLVAGVLAGIAVVGAILAAVAWIAWIAITGRVPGHGGSGRGRSAEEDEPTNFLASMFGHKVGFMEQFDGTLRDHRGKQRGSISSDGSVYDENSNRVGSFNSVEGTFQDNRGNVIAHISRRTGELRNASGSMIAYHNP